ncbi:Uncharacterised protein, partial [Mycoplasma putrefaciens]
MTKESVNISGIESFSFKKIGINSIDQFYKILTSNQNQTDHTFKIVNQYYNNNIDSAFKIEGILFAAAGLAASFISGPLLVFAITKKKKYKIFILPLLLAFSLVMFVVMPVISTLSLLIFIFTPLFALLYSYRTALDPW